MLNVKGGIVSASILGLAAITGCPAPEPQSPQADWNVVLSGLPGGLLSVSGTASDDVYVVGADSGDGPSIYHYDGTAWTKLNTAASGGLWWITDRLVDDSFFMVGDGGLALRYRPASGVFETMETPGSVRLFGVWGMQANNVYAVGGDVESADTSGVIWHFDGTSWSAQDLSGVNPDGVPVLFKVWGRSDNEVYAVGSNNTVLRFDGTSWTRIPPPADAETFFTVHGNDTLVVAVGGSQSGTIVEAVAGSFGDVTPAGTLQVNGVFVTSSGDAAAVGLEGTVTLRRNGIWADAPTGLNLDARLDFHGAWIDLDGGVWAVGGNIIGEPQTDGIVVYYGTADIATNIASN